MADNLRNIIDRQKEVLAELEVEYSIIENSDIAKENAELKADLEKLSFDIDRISDDMANLEEENVSLKNALYEQLYNEKIKIVNTSTHKLETYFETSKEEGLDKLTALEIRVKERIDTIRETLVKNNIETEDDIYSRLTELNTLLDNKVTEAKAKVAKMSDAFSAEEREELEALRNEEISDEQVAAIAKKNNIESFIGLNVLNAVGIFLLIVGAITLAQFTYKYLPDLLKGIILFVLGGVMLSIGEILNRKKPNIFSLGISAGGVGILYAALATSYFGLHILTIYPALIICVGITSVAFILSNRYNSQIITTFALIGGYLPMFTLGTDEVVIYGAMVYFVALNLLALLISFSKKWRISSFIGLFLNIVGTFYICYNFYGTNDELDKILVIIYVLFAFLVYTAIPIISTYRVKAKFRKADIVLLAINTFFSSSLIFAVFYSFGFEDYNGLLAVLLAVIYLLLGRFIEKGFNNEESNTSALFYITGLTFVVLTIPLQFDRVWLSLGWLAEGVILATYGILMGEKRFKQAGLIISLFCLIAFIMVDCTYIEDELFVYKYSAITLGSLLILAAHMYKRIMSGLFIKIYKYLALINLWLYAMYIILDKVAERLFNALAIQDIYQPIYLLGAITVTVTFFLSYLYSRIKLISDWGTRILSAILYIIGVLLLFLLNSIDSPVSSIYLRYYSPNWGTTIVGVIIITFTAALSVLAVREIMKMIVVGRKVGVEWYPLIVSGYFVLVLTQNLITQFNLSFSDATISIIYVLTALLWIIYGFMKRYSFIRRFGLGLALLSVIKLFLIDLAGLTQGYQIITYFSLGITLLAISFVYQYFSKRLELKGGISFNEKEDN